MARTRQTISAAGTDVDIFNREEKTNTSLLLHVAVRAKLLSGIDIKALKTVAIFFYRLTCRCSNISNSTSKAAFHNVSWSLPLAAAD